MRIDSFRAGHNLTLAAAIHQSEWVYSVPQGKPHLVTYSPAVKLKYSYHMHMFQNVGFLLGTQFSLLWEMGLGEEWSPHGGVGLPSVDAGLVWNTTKDFRISTDIGYLVTWFPQARAGGKNIAMLNDTLEWTLTAERFTTSTRALAVGVGFRHMTPGCDPSWCSDQDIYLNGLHIQNDAPFFFVGATWILGDELGK